MRGLSTCPDCKDRFDSETEHTCGSEVDSAAPCSPLRFGTPWKVSIEADGVEITVKNFDLNQAIERCRSHFLGANAKADSSAVAD